MEEKGKQGNRQFSKVGIWLRQGVIRIGICTDTRRFNFAHEMRIWEPDQDSSKDTPRNEQVHFGTLEAAGEGGSYHLLLL